MPLQMLALDLGAESGRAMLGRLDGGKLDLQEIHRFPNGPVRLPDGLHWNAPGLFGELKTGLRKAREEAGAGPAGFGRAGYLGRRFWPAGRARRSAGQPLPLPRQPHRRDGGKGLRHGRARNHLRSDRHPVHAAQQPVPAVGPQAGRLAGPGRRQHLPDHAGPVQLLADRAQGVRIQQSPPPPNATTRARAIGPARCSSGWASRRTSSPRSCRPARCWASCCPGWRRKPAWPACR